MSPNPYLDLLRELGVDIPEDEWNRVHGIEPPSGPAPEGPTEPTGWDEENELPYFTSSQLEVNLPETYGFEDYLVYEDDATAHPFGLNYDDEVYYRANHRPKHRYSRPYRIRWTLSHLIGTDGKLPEELAERLRAAQPPPRDVLQTRGAYEWVRARLKAWGCKDLYLSIPFIVARLGGPRWRLTFRQTMGVYEDALRLHRTFDELRRQGRMRRQRFPKMQYVLLRLLDRHGVVPPYRIPWARTSIKRRQLRDFLADLTEERTPWIVPEERKKCDSPPPTTTASSCDPCPAREPSDGASGTTTGVGASADDGPARDSPPFSNATSSWFGARDSDWPSPTFTPPAAWPTTTIASGDCTSGTTDFWDGTCSTGRGASTR